MVFEREGGEKTDERGNLSKTGVKVMKH